MSATSKIEMEQFKSNKYKILFHSFHARAIILEYTSAAGKCWCVLWVESWQILSRCGSRQKPEGWRRWAAQEPLRNVSVARLGCAVPAFQQPAQPLGRGWIPSQLRPCLTHSCLSIPPQGYAAFQGCSSPSPGGWQSLASLRACQERLQPQPRRAPGAGTASLECGCSLEPCSWEGTRVSVASGGGAGRLLPSLSDFNEILYLLKKKNQ